jgi:HTH-type transcriptional regulator/antitoxin MqsA
MLCPNCGSTHISTDTRDIIYVYKGQKTLVPAVNGQFCEHCHESFLDVAESKRYSDAIMEFQKKVNANLIDPNFITSVRKKLKLDQKQAAEIFGGGVNAFSRYETGKATPPVALVKLLKVLDKHPSLLAEIS